ncbi:MAG TPA: OsmC family protein [Candidatus Dormibacteraeota bacterium]|nr:OsmC family protein [Candidatus Dormibacteraeota bacterium]
MTKAVVRWTGQNVHFDIESESGHKAEIDEGAPYGRDLAMRPTEMLLGSLGACTGINVVLLCTKYKQPLKALEVEVEGERQAEWPKGFTKIEITFHCTWDGDIDKKMVEQAIELACNRYCPIHATLSHGVQIEHHRKDHR